MSAFVGIALVCVAASSAKADESISRFFVQQASRAASQVAPNPSSHPATIAAKAARTRFRTLARPHAAPRVRARLVGGAGARVIRASWYGGHERLGRRTASGEVFRPDGLTCAHRSLPLGTRLIVSANGRSVEVRVNDRGPAAYTGRSIDLSRGAARALGMIGAGTARVTYRIASL